MLELPGIDDENGVGHGVRPGSAAWRFGCARRSMATAQDAMRVRDIVGARGQNDRHSRAEHDAGRIGAAKEGQILGQHVAGFEIGHDQDLGLARRPAT